MEFTNIVHVLFVLVCAFSIATSRKSEHQHAQQSDQPDANNNGHHNNGDIMKKLQELERNQGLTDGNVARLEHIIEAQTKLIQAQSEELHHLETVVKKEANRMKHVFHVSRENRHRAFLLGKILKQNNLTNEDFTLGKHNHGHQHVDRQGTNNGDRKNNRPNPANRQHNHNNHHQQQEEGNRQEQKPHNHNHNQKQGSEENQQHHHHHKQQKDDNDQSQQHHHHKQQDSAEAVSPTRHEHNPHSSSETNGKQDVTSNKDTNDKKG